jgi:regulatory protein
MPFGRSGKQAAPLAEPALYDYAIKALGRHMRTEAELRRLLAARAEPGESGQAVIKTVLARLREHGYLNDAAFAETYTRLRQENERLGSRRVRQNLAQKGIASSVAQQAVDARYAGADEEALARAHLERKRIRKPENEKESARVVRRLASAGFSTGVIYKILRQWDVPVETLAGLETIDEDSNNAENAE